MIKIIKKTYNFSFILALLLVVNFSFCLRENSDSNFLELKTDREIRRPNVRPHFIPHFRPENESENESENKSENESENESENKSENESENKSENEPHFISHFRPHFRPQNESQNIPKNNDPNNIYIGKTFFIKSTNFAEEAMRRRGIEIWKEPLFIYNNNADFIFFIRKALNGRSNNISIESFISPGTFMRHRDFLLYTEKSDGSEIFKDDASFKIVNGLSGVFKSVSFESSNYPGYFIRHENGRCRISRNDNTQLFFDDASWILKEQKPKN